ASREDGSYVGAGLSGPSNVPLDIDAWLIRFNDPVKFHTDEQIPLPGAMIGGTSVPVATLEVRAGWVYINMNLTRVTGVGTIDVWSGVSAKYCPPDTIVTSCNLAATVGMAFLRPDGTIAVLNQTGANRAWVMMSF